MWSLETGGVSGGCTPASEKRRRLAATAKARARWPAVSSGTSTGQVVSGSTQSMSLKINSSRGGQGVAAATSRAAIPVAAPDLVGNEEAYVVEAIRSSWISSTGPFVQRFESEFAKLCGTRTSLGVCNGTVALHLALLGLHVRPGDEVLVPSLTYIPPANAVRYVGAEPVFVDVDPATWCMDPKLLEASITPRPKGIIAVP